MAVHEATEIVVNRILKAPVATVWKLWTDPELVTKWWGPEDYTAPSAEIDLRVGGRYIFSMQAPLYQGGAESFTSGIYKKIIPLQLLEFTQSVTDRDGIDMPVDQLPENFSQNVHTVVEFSDVNGLTQLTITERGWTKSLMSVFAYAGMHQSLDKFTAELFQYAASKE
ncbi:MAG: SRPBCC domain-containing protein [Actinobacteria bacterium]|nr:SRPBCC domain-containing protein [Actinomycetota bacterium]